MSENLLEITNIAYALCERIRKWMKDVTLVIEREGLSDNTKLLLCNEIECNRLNICNDIEMEIMNNKELREGDKVITLFMRDICKLMRMIEAYIELFVKKFNVPECMNEPEYKRELVYVLLGSLSMINDNLYVYRVSNIKFMSNEKM